jgi:hypothetical protein
MQTGWRWVAPPGWPQPPAGFVPPPGWQPDPSWGPAPPDWSFWQRDPIVLAVPPHPRSSARRSRVLGIAGMSVAVVVLGVSLLPEEEARTSGRTVGRTTAPAPTATAAAPAVPESAVPGSAVPGSAGPGSASALLSTLAVKGRAPRTGYNRDRFGPSWADIDRNGCDTRNDVLRRDLQGETFREGTRGCVVITGTLVDPYTAATVSFTKARAGEVEIDHVVSLSNAWQTGASGWPDGKRLAFANDPLNLLATTRSANQQKSDGDAATWLPPNKAYRCAMVARQVGVKAKYQLWVTPAERDAVRRVLSTCPNQPAPRGGSPTSVAAAPRPRASSSAPRTPAVTTRPASGGGGTAREYANCTELRRDYRGGVARPGAVDSRPNGGQARYRPHYDAALYEANRKSDRDKDGIACEN